jgi:hypothetical protein
MSAERKLKNLEIIPSETRTKTKMEMGGNIG